MTNKGLDGGDTGSTLMKINAHPAKAFFVWMITRDIDLADAILDLLDNCVDGARRMGLKSGMKPYSGYFAHIDFDERGFTIKDNCGGIPKPIAEHYAFRFGRPEGKSDPTVGTIGVYGIGMKRAILKMGVNCVVRSETVNDSFEVEITPDWLRRDRDWDLIGTPIARDKTAPGTTIRVSKLHTGVAEQFKTGHFFREEFPRIVEASLALLLARGFEIRINGENLGPKLPVLLWQRAPNKSGDGGSLIRPYVCRGKIGCVDFFLAVGFRGQISEDASIPEDPVGRWEMEDAGWTIACNERVVVACDKTRLTGWETHGVPRYHAQFRGISGFVEFHSDDPKQLPMPTTKRGVDGSSSTYLLVRDQMIQGLKKFTTATNAWKGAEIQLNALLKKADPMAITDIREKAREELKFTRHRSQTQLESYTPTLPTHQAKQSNDRKILFTRPIAQIRTVAGFLFENKDVDPNDVGAECFDRVLREAKE